MPWAGGIIVTEAVGAQVYVVSAREVYTVVSSAVSTRSKVVLRLHKSLRSRGLLNVTFNVMLKIQLQCTVEKVHANDGIHFCMHS